MCVYIYIYIYMKFNRNKVSYLIQKEHLMRFASLPQPPTRIGWTGGLESWPSLEVH